MNIRQVTDGKEDYIELLRMGDPDESRIRKVLEEVLSKKNFYSLFCMSAI